MGQLILTKQEKIIDGTLLEEIVELTLSNIDEAIIILNEEFPMQVHMKR